MAAPVEGGKGPVINYGDGGYKMVRGVKFYPNEKGGLVEKV